MWTVLAIGAAVGAVMLAWPARVGVQRLHESETWQVPGWARGRPHGVTTRRRVTSGLLAAAGCFALLGGTALAAGIAAMVGIGVGIGLGFLSVGREAKRRAQLALDLPSTLELMAAALQAGAPIAVATRQVAAGAPDTVRPELELILARSAIGDSDANAWRASRERPVIGPVARDVARSSESGSALVACLRRHAEAGRRERRAALEARAKAVGVRGVVPMAVCFLPAFVAVGVVPIVAGIALNLMPH